MMQTAVTIICLFFSCLVGTQAWAEQKKLIGETAWVEVGDIPFAYLARIDTGARITSIHAVDVKITDGSSVPDENVGKTVAFQTVNRDGKNQVMSAVIMKVSTVKNSQGTEQRYVIELPLSWKDVNKKVEVNLRDRSKMTYKLLIGRNWLSKNFLVDVDMKAPAKGGN
ncbi:MAG: RimK/LysX family protein [Thermodesulfobacteriota bacterium]|nr:RimK/LysX family protein [Thermodesulfobacteriota bacterium]